MMPILPLPTMNVPTTSIRPPIAGLLLTGPRWTCLALDPKPRHWRVSERKRRVGETQHMTSSLESPPIESCRRCVNRLFLYGMWGRCSARAPSTSASADRLLLMKDASLRAVPVTPETPNGWNQRCLWCLKNKIDNYRWWRHLSWICLSIRVDKCTCHWRVDLSVWRGSNCNSLAILRSDSQPQKSFNWSTPFTTLLTNSQPSLTKTCVPDRILLFQDLKQNDQTHFLWSSPIPSPATFIVAKFVVNENQLVACWKRKHAVFLHDRWRLLCKTYYYLHMLYVCGIFLMCVHYTVLSQLS